MNIDILDKIELLRPNHLYAVVREDGQVASVTNNKSNIPDMIKDEYCGVGVELVNNR
jgi:hypothetical protein